MGFLQDLFGMGGKKDAKTAKNASRWLPPQINVGGATATFDRGNPASNIPGSATTMLSPEQQAFRDQLQQFASNSLSRLDNSANGTPAVPGYPGITPELYNQFQLSTQFPQTPYGTVGNIYQPNLSGMGAVRGANFNAAGLPQVTFDPNGVPQIAGIDTAGMPKAGGSVNWKGKAEGLDQNYLDKSKSFLNAANPVTGFDGLATDWYNGLRQLSQADQNNMLAGAGDKQFLRGMLDQQTGNGYNPAMKAAFAAYDDQQLKDKMAGYQVAADASTRNLQQALAAGGYVQQNDATRLQQAIAQGQIDAQTSAANAANWLGAKGLNLQAQQANANNWLGAQGLGVQAQQANAGNWLTGQGLGLQAQGMNQQADIANIDNYLRGQGMLTEASGAQANRDLGVNAQTLGQNTLNANIANQQFGNAAQLFGLGQNTINANTQNLLAQLAAGAGGVGGYDQYLLNMLATQGNLASAQSAANANAYQMPVQVGMNTSNFWSNVYGNAVNGMFQNSDRRLKTNIERIGTTPGGFPWYKFDYVWGTPGEGVMSDEVPAEWVTQDEAGFDVVDYSKVH